MAGRLSSPTPTMGGLGRLVTAIGVNRSLRLPVSILGGLVVVAILGPVIWAHSATAVDPGAALESPSLAHPMGTDSVGRDVLARFLEGARISLACGALVALSAAFLGCLIGVLAGTMGGLTDSAAMRTMDALLAFPPLILAMTIALGLGAGLVTASIGIAISSVPIYARLIRSDVLRVRSLGFVEAAIALGATRSMVIRRHVLPHIASTLAVQVAAVFGYAILAIAALGFIGLGAQIPTPEWGAMITDGLDTVLTGAWWIGVFPGLGVLAAVTGATLLADAIRDILDPRRTR